MSRPARHPGPAPVHGRFALRAPRLIDGTGAPVRRDALVVVDDGAIGAVDDASTIGDPGITVIDLPGVTLLPGYVDAHTHLWWGEPAEPLDPQRAQASVATTAARALAGGTTTARDLGGPSAALLPLRAAIDAGLLPGPRLLVAGPPVTVPGGHCHWFGLHATTVSTAHAAVADLVALGVDVVKLMVTGGMSTPGSDPYAPQVPLDVARAVVASARSAGLPVAAHALGTPGVRHAIAAEVDTLEHGWTITGREQRFEPDVVPLLARTPIIASVTAHHALRDLLPGPGDAAGDLAEIRRRLIPHRAVRAAGVPMVVHSDCGPDTTRYEAFGESVLVFLLGMEATLEAAVHAATAIPARALGLAERVGTLAPGRLADIVALDGDPGADPDAFRRVRAVWQGGRHVAEGGRLRAQELPGAMPPG